MEFGTSSGRTVTADRSCNLSALARLATLVTCAMDETIYHCEEPRYWYRMISGAARKCSLSADGRRQIVDFLLPGDVFGFGADDFHHFSTESVVSGTMIERYPRHLVLKLAESEAHVSLWICEMAFKSIARLQARTLILGHTSALARLSAFLLEWEDRCEQVKGTAISLPMSRYDIADYLAIAVETVSRAFTMLRTRQVIAFRSTRQLTICNRQALRIATEGTDVAGAN